MEVCPRRLDTVFIFAPLERTFTAKLCRAQCHVILFIMYAIPLLNFTPGNTHKWNITLCENPVFDVTEYRLTEIAPYSFCADLVDSPFSIVIPPTVSIIRHHAFFMNSNLMNISFTEGLKFIENQAFVGCSLKSLQTCPFCSDIFTIQGICLKRGASRADIEALPSGLYIIDSRKVRR